MVYVTPALVDVNEKISPPRANHNRVTLDKVKAAAGQVLRHRLSNEW